MAAGGLPVPYYDDGTCTIYHGDSRELLADLAADVVVTDPPYGINLDTDYRRFKGVSPNRVWEQVKGDDRPFDPSPYLAGRCVLFGANYYSDALPLGQWVIWNKRDLDPNSFALSDAEMIWHNCGGQAIRVFNWFWRGCYRKGEMRTPVLHPTQKPIALMEYLVQQFSEPDDVILDPFMGSGTTLRAAKDTGRRAIGIEVEERYCEIAAKRLAQEVLPLGAT